MAETVTIARPYAEAAFRTALDKQRITEWSDMLQLVAGVAADPQMSHLIGNPRVPKGTVEQLFLNVGGDRIDALGRNFLRVLSENGRLALLPQIRELFEAARAEHEKQLEARVTSAFAISEEELKPLIDKLEARYQRKVKATVTVDPELIGGVRIVIGDEVLDASVRGRLDAMAYALTR